MTINIETVYCNQNQDILEPEPEVENDLSIPLEDLVIGNQHGVIFKYENKVYIISTAHNLPNDTMFMLDDSTLELLYFNEDLDVSIFEYFSKNIEETKYCINMNIIEGSIFCNNALGILLEYQNIQSCGYKKNKFDISFLYYNCSKHKDSKTIVYGHSGCPIYNYNNELVGLLGFNQDGYGIIPIINFIKVIENKNNMCYYYENLKLIKNNLKIQKPHNMNYNDDDLISESFERNDILLKVDSLIINPEGFIYNQNLDIYIPINIYILLFKKNKEKCVFNVCRKNQSKTLDINIYCNSYKNIK